MWVDPLEAYKLLSPRIVVLLTSINSKHGINAVPVDLILPVNHSPPILMIALKSRGQTHKNIKESGEFVVNLMSKKYTNEVMRCTTRYQEGIDKIKQVGLHSFSSRLVKVPRIKEAKAWIECRLADEILFKDHVAIFADIIAVEVSDEIVADGKLDHSKINPILYITKDYMVELKVVKKKKIKKY